MITLIEIRKAIMSALLGAHPRIYSEVAPDDAVFPYITYDFSDSIDDGTLERFELDLDGWDAPAAGNTTALETMMDAADKALHRKTLVIDNDLSMTFYRENRRNLRDDDPRIFRRQNTYQIRVHGGS